MKGGKKTMNEKTYRLVMVGGLYLGIILFVLAIILLAKNVQEIKEDPIIYGMDKHDFNMCTCYKPDGQFVVINLDDFKKDRGEE